MRRPRARRVALSRGKESLRSASGDASARIDGLIQMVEGILTRRGKAERHRFVRGRARAWKFTGLQSVFGDHLKSSRCAPEEVAPSFDSGRIAHAADLRKPQVSLLPAGRGELFAQRFSVDDGQVRELDTAAHLSPDAILERYGESSELVWAGEGAHQLAETLRAWRRQGMYRSTIRGGSDHMAPAPLTNQLAIRSGIGAKRFTASEGRKP